MYEFLQRKRPAMSMFKPYYW